MPFIWNEFIDFFNQSSTFEHNKEKIVIKIIDLLGRSNNNNNFYIKIYNDGSVEKNGLIK